MKIINVMPYFRYYNFMFLGIAVRCKTHVHHVFSMWVSIEELFLDIQNFKITIVYYLLHCIMQDTFDVRICLARTEKYTVNFQTAQESDLHNIEIPLSFVITQAGTIHGLAFWFDVAFLGSQ